MSKLLRTSYVGLKRATYVYLAFAQGDGGAYVKVGMSSNPLCRLKRLRAPNGANPHSMYASSSPATDVALGYEVEHDILRDTRAHACDAGEWRFVPIAQSDVFQRIFDRADQFVQKSISEAARMERLDIPNLPALGMSE